MYDNMLTFNDVAERLKVSVSTVKRLVKSKQIRSVKIGHLRRFRPTDVSAFVAGRECG